MRAIDVIYPWRGQCACGLRTLSSTAIRAAAARVAPLATTCDDGAIAPPSCSADAALAEQITAEVYFMSREIDNRTLEVLEMNPARWPRIFAPKGCGESRR